MTATLEESYQIVQDTITHCDQLAVLFPWGEGRDMFGRFSRHGFGLGGEGGGLLMASRTSGSCNALWNLEAQQISHYVQRVPTCISSRITSGTHMLPAIQLSHRM